MPIFSSMRGSIFYRQIFKPLLDRLFALFLIVFTLPLQIFIALLLTVHFSKSPIFIQSRIGRGERVFPILKFRTMKEDEDNESLSWFGRLLRSSSLDELPQVYNILIGQMSFIGPRPLLVEYLDYYNAEEKRRHEVYPGITGWAQINGRNKIDWPMRMMLDIEYVDNLSFLLDLKIMAKTFLEVFRWKRTTFNDNVIITFSEYASKR